MLEINCVLSINEMKFRMNWYGTYPCLNRRKFNLQNKFNLFKFNLKLKDKKTVTIIHPIKDFFNHWINTGTNHWTVRIINIALKHLQYLTSRHQAMWFWISFPNWGPSDHHRSSVDLPTWVEYLSWKTCSHSPAASD